MIDVRLLDNMKSRPVINEAGHVIVSPELWKLLIDIVENSIYLPCKVGDTVYKLWYHPCHLGETHPDSYDCCGCEDECDLKLAITEVVVPNERFIVENFIFQYNVVYYLNRKDAEKALSLYQTEGHK